MPGSGGQPAEDLSISVHFTVHVVTIPLLCVMTESGENIPSELRWVVAVSRFYLAVWEIFFFVGAVGVVVDWFKFMFH